MRARIAAGAVGALLVILATILGVSGASGHPPLPGGPHATFRPPGFGGPVGDPVGDPVGTVPAPFVQGFAAGGPHLGASPSPKVRGTAQVTVDGCEHAYGTAAQCVPLSFPPGVTDRCGWLREHGFGPLAVRGPDRLGLDTNHDRVACGPGDR